MYKIIDSRIRTILTLLVWWAPAWADDWPQWGGPQRDLVWREQGIVEDLPQGDLPRLWSAPVASGYAGPAVAQGRVFLTDRVESAEVERIRCFDAVTGDVVWSHEYQATYNTIEYRLGPRATPTVDGQRVYTLGAVGHLSCLNGATGEVVWEKHLPTEFDAPLPVWGTAAAPLVDDEQLIVLVGGRPGGLLISFDKETGSEIWRNLDDIEVGYCPPVILTIGGNRQLVQWHPQGVTGLDPEDGTLLWNLPTQISAGLTIAIPRQLGTRLFCSAFYEGAVMIELGDDGRSPEILWKSAEGNNEVRNDSLHALMCTPVATEKYIFGVGGYGELRCLDTQTGKILWETYEATGRGRWWNAFLVVHQDRVFICNEQGELILAKLTGNGYEEIARASLIEPTQTVKRRKAVWSHPAFAMRSVFARNDKELVRVSLAAE